MAIMPLSKKGIIFMATNLPGISGASQSQALGLFNQSASDPLTQATVDRPLTAEEAIGVEISTEIASRIRQAVITQHNAPNVNTSDPLRELRDRIITEMEEEDTKVKAHSAFTRASLALNEAR